MQKKQALGAHGLLPSMTAVGTLPVRVRCSTPSAFRRRATGQSAVRRIGDYCAAQTISVTC